MDLTSAPAPALWFEFMLDHDKLNQHLETNSCDPPPTQLINLFLRSSLSDNASNFQIGSMETQNEIDICPDVPTGSFEANYQLNKNYGLRILAIKVASRLKWDLEIICNELNLPMQLILMHSLMRLCNKSKDMPKDVRNFIEIIYSRWLLRTAIKNYLSSLQPQSQSTTIIYLSQYQQQQQTADNNIMNYMKELLAPSSKELEKWSSFLKEYTWCLNNNQVPSSAKRMKSSDNLFERAELARPKMECFDTDFRTQQHDWKECESIDKRDLLEGACYDLGRYYFFKESYEFAKGCFEMIKNSSKRFPLLLQYLDSATKLISVSDKKVVIKKEPGVDSIPVQEVASSDQITNSINETRVKTEKYLFDCMTQFSKLNVNKNKNVVKSEFKNIVKTEIKVEYQDLGDFNQDSDLRFNTPNNLNHNKHNHNGQSTTNMLLPTTRFDWYQLMNPSIVDPPHIQETKRGDLFMSQGNPKEAMACFIGSLMLMTDYFRKFSKNYLNEEPYISRMIQSSISLSCFTQAVALCQMNKNLNYTIAFKQLNERICNDCCDDIYECIWNVTLLEYIINLHSKRGEVERRTKVMQLIGQLELNENNSDDVLREAEQVRRGKFFRILSNKYL